MPMKHPLRNLFAAGLVLAFAAPATADVNDLVAFLERAERMYAVNRTLQADITMADSEGKTSQAVLLVDPTDEGRQLFVRDQPPWRSLTPLTWSSGSTVDADGHSVDKIGIDDPLGGTDFRGIDFFPFWKNDYSNAFIADENRNEKTVSLYAADGRPYKLFVISFDKVQLTPRIIKYYRDGFNDLVRIRTDRDHVMVGGRPRPTKIMIQDYAENRTRTYTLKWKVVDEVPPNLAGVGADSNELTGRLSGTHRRHERFRRHRPRIPVGQTGQTRWPERRHRTPRF